MDHSIRGMHHITAIAGDAQRNYTFYTRTLGLRLVKKTVNFDDPGTYHFYYGNETGTPGTILTFFPWKHVKQGVNGTGMATEIGYSVPPGSLDFWKARLAAHQVTVSDQETWFGEPSLRLTDPDGLNLRLIESGLQDDRSSWTTDEIGAAQALKGFHSIVLTLRSIEPTASVLTGIFGYRLVSKEGPVTRYITDQSPNASIVDLFELPDGKPGINAGGTNHHVAFRVSNEEALMQFREKIVARGFQITPKIDRNYFFSLYFREPGGVLFELATDNPGFTVDESLEELGQHLRLPEQYEPQRAHIEKVLPALVNN